MVFGLPEIVVVGMYRVSVVRIIEGYDPMSVRVV
jgi:hypothetical protein